MPGSSRVWSAIAKAGGDPRGPAGRIFECYYEPVHRYLCRRGVSPEDAQDVAQSVFMNFCKHDFLARVDRSKGTFRGLLLTITKHVLSVWKRDMRRLKRGGSAFHISLDAAVLVHLADLRPQEADAEFDHEWKRSIVERALKELEAADGEGTPYAKAVRMHYLDGKSYAEIASALSVAESSIHNYVGRGKKRLRELATAVVGEYARTDEEAKADLAMLDD